MRGKRAGEASSGEDDRPGCDGKGRWEGEEAEAVGGGVPTGAREAGRRRDVVEGGSWGRAAEGKEGREERRERKRERNRRRGAEKGGGQRAPGGAKTKARERLA